MSDIIIAQSINKQNNVIFLKHLNINIRYCLEIRNVISTLDN